MAILATEKDRCCNNFPLHVEIYLAVYRAFRVKVKEQTTCEIIWRNCQFYVDQAVQNQIV
ncbi:hypothetical protein NQ317_017880 [Molorchus minor]|uniref:Uncharacterized protein n=1 Tax=Molorchus minor TaxID=1323400 RepID=A0ABQ9JEG1_9CUCU|nr:hypothetical protein NQ317_017880 [Molorchus minor]